MRSKHFVALITFFACFALSIFLVGRPQIDNVAGKKILVLLHQDIKNGDNRNVDELGLSEGYKSFSSLAAKSRIIAKYVENSGSMDDSDLPRDFQIVWRKHMKAWANYSDFLQKSQQAGLDAKDIKRLEIQYGRDINSTWYIVLRVGASYGAEFPY